MTKQRDDRAGTGREPIAQMGALCASLLAMVACASSPRPIAATPIAGIEISAMRELSGEPLVIPFGRGADGHALLRRVLLVARERGADEVSKIEFHLPYTQRGENYDCVSVVGPPIEAYRRSRRMRERDGAFALQAKRDNPTRPSYHAQGTAFRVGSAPPSGPHVARTMRYPHFDQNEFNPIDWVHVGRAYSKSDMLAMPPQVCLPTRQPVQRAIHATIHVPGPRD